MRNPSLYIPLVKGVPGVEYEYWPPNKGQPPASGGWEPTPNGKGYRRPKGSGGAKTTASKTENEASTPAKDQDVPTENAASDAVKETGLSDKMYSSSKDKFKNSTPEEHYILHASAKDKDPKLAEMHLNMAREKSKDLSPDEHRELSDKLREHHDKYSNLGLDEHAAIHEEQFVSGSVEERKSPEDTSTEDTSTEDTSTEDTTQSRNEAKQKAYDEGVKQSEEAYESAKKEHTDAKESAKKEAEAKYKDAKARVEASNAKKLKDHKAKAKKIESRNNRRLRKYEKRQKEHREVQAKIAEHRKNRPVKPGPEPKVPYDATPAQFEKLRQHKKAVKQYKKDDLEWKTKMSELQKEKKLAPKKPKLEKVPPKPKMDKAPSKSDFKSEFNDPAPKKSDFPKPEKPDLEEEPQSPSTDLDKESLSARNKEVSGMVENLKSHIDRNPDLSDEDKASYQKVIAALEKQSNLSEMPTKDQDKEYKQAQKLAGEHGKAAHAEPEKPQVPQTEMEVAALAEYNSNVSKLRDNVQSHLDSSSDLSDEDKQKLKNVLAGLDGVSNLKTMPTKEQQALLKQGQKLSGDHGKKSYEEVAGDEDSAATPPKKDDTKNSFTSGFKTGRQVGTQVGSAAASEYGAGALASQTVNYAADGAVASGHHLLKDKQDDKQETKKSVSRLVIRQDLVGWKI